MSAKGDVLVRDYDPLHDVAPAYLLWKVSGQCSIDWRGKGLGRALCEAAAEQSRRAGATHVDVEEVEPRIVPFYQKMGARVQARSLLAAKHLTRCWPG